ncbi:hypothetical protein HanIR_Chr08g0372011 [Helianthus annuus]|nr:hypothetical protein HanIR_Chr08g0372011 [Helianthus annuus]
MIVSIQRNLIDELHNRRLIHTHKTQARHHSLPGLCCLNRAHVWSRGALPGLALWAGQPGQTPRPKRFIGPKSRGALPGPALWAGQPGQTPRPKRFIGPNKNLGSRFLNEHCYLKCLINEFSNKNEASSMVKILKFENKGHEF